MTYYTAKDLADSFRTVRKNTIIVAEEIPENQYGFRAAPETHTVAQMLYHVAAAPNCSSRSMPSSAAARSRGSTSRR